MEMVRFVAASGGLGGGKVNAEALAEAMTLKPHFVASDAGSTDSGPYALGSGRANYPRESVMRDLDIMLDAALPAGVPVVIGSAGTAGIDRQVDDVLSIAAEIARKRGRPIKVATIHSEQAPDYLLDLYRRGRIEALDAAPEINEAILRNSRVVGMMGVEPLQQALAEGAELVIAGRCSDSAIYAAMPIAMGMPEGASWHAGKVFECGTLVCETAGAGVVYGEIHHDGFLVRPYGQGLRCTPQSVAAHTLYESADPFIHHESSGHMDLTDCSFEALDERTVWVTGSKFVRSGRSTVKLEGALHTGYQAIMIGGIRDPYIIRQLDDWLAAVRARIGKSVADILGNQVGPDQYRVDIHVYGRNAVMGQQEPLRNILPHEVGLVLEATAPDQKLATKIAELSRQPLLHHPVPEWKGAITGFACLHNPAVIDRGAVYRFSLNHIAVPDKLSDMFRIRHLSV
ncbi:Protein of unknown function [Xaviernesmea oryzae]|uniref:Acyclic terpene utilisation N-terminal domain-containing protein n=1 Tax=Xaviernesmea oryzae TaxID=464029 RepID=A0A1X7FQJ5_9HYPH|nr:acyclic terpene utilization AtuA family protein [Xaviernesmea oryzae]SMF56728.1 Protein of unknown function [Xaviernesmea oryzae]